MFIKYEKSFDILNEKKDKIPLKLSQTQVIEDLNQYVYLRESPALAL